MTDTASIPVVPTAPAAPDQPAPTVGDFVKVTNNGSSDLKLTYDSRPWIVAAGDTVLVPFEVANLYFGDPRSGAGMASLKDEVGRVSWVNDRATEVRRLALLHHVDLTTDGQFPIHGERTVPDVTVTDLNNRPIVTVLQDPSGETTTQKIVTVSENAQMLSIMQAQQRQLDELKAKLAQSDPSYVPETPPVATHVDPGSGQTFVSTTSVIPDTTAGESVDNPLDLVADTPTADATPSDSPPEDMGT